MATTLTRRQHEFLGQFQDIFQDLGEPIHYVSLAEKLGIAKVTAYEMLRLLEERGLVQAEYQLPADGRGPGRSMVLFSPTAEAIRYLRGRVEEGHEAWEQTKAALLKRLQEAKETGYESLLEDLIAKIPEHQSLMVYLTEMVTATMLSLKKLGDHAETNDLINQMQRIGLPDEIDLSSLPGMNAITMMVEHANQKACRFLGDQGGSFQSRLAQLGEENRQRLSAYAREVAKFLKG